MCFFCNQKMTPTKPPTKNTVPDTEATLYHLDDRYSKDRGKYPGKERTVCACRGCADERSKNIQALQSIEDLRRRSRHGEDSDYSSS